MLAFPKRPRETLMSLRLHLSLLVLAVAVIGGLGCGDDAEEVPDTAAMRQLYLDNMGDRLGAMADRIAEIDDLVKRAETNPDVVRTSADWRYDATETARMGRVTVTGARNSTPPPSLREFHAELLKAFDAAERAFDALDRAVATGDATHLRTIPGIMAVVTLHTERAAAMLPAR